MMKEIIRDFLGNAMGYEEESLIEELTQLVESFYAIQLETEYSLGHDDGYKEGEKYGYEDGYDDAMCKLDIKSDN